MVDQNTQAQLKKRFAELPEPVQRAITSVDVQKQLREAADRHKLHLDQWEILENEVLMTLFGITPIDELQTSIKNEVKVSTDVAAELASDISRIVFEPIRRELERQLEHPEAKAEQLSGEEQARREILSRNTEEATAPQPVAGSLKPEAPQDATTSYESQARSYVAPATPPNPPPTERAVRAPTSSLYKAGEPSSARKDVHNDPYREAPQ